MNKQDFKIEEMYPLISEIISSGGSFRLFPKGISMLPTIKQGVDSVELAAPKKLKKYDVVLYKRPNGQFVIHRIMKIKGEEATLCGDNQVSLEKGVDLNDILAKVIGIYKGEKLFKNTDFFYKVYSFVWANTRVFRRVWRGARRKIKKHLIFKGK